MNNIDSLIVLHVAYVTNDFTSGVSTVVPQYLNAQEKQPNVMVALLKLANNQIENTTYPVFSKMALRELPAPFCNPSIVVFHEIYRPEFPKLSADLIKRSIPYIITPHGSLTTIAQAHKHFTKSILNALFYNRFIQKADYVHYLSEKDATSSSNFKCTNACIIPNGVDIPNINPNYEKTNVASFIGRLDIEVKGLDLLINSVPPIAKELRSMEAKINIYGPDDNGSADKLMQLIKHNNISDLVFLKGAVSGQSKSKALQESKFYIQLSRTEAFGVAILEALSYGLPIIVTEGTTWKKIANEKNLGIGVDSSIKDISEAILTLFRNDTLRNAMATTSRKYAINEYQWKSITEQQLSLYRNVAHHISK